MIYNIIVLETLLSFICLTDFYLIIWIDESLFRDLGILLYRVNERRRHYNWYF